MENLVELFIVAGAFGLVGSYLFIISRFIKKDEHGTSQLASPPVSRFQESAPALGRAAAHAH